MPAERRTLIEEQRFEYDDFDWACSLSPCAAHDAPIATVDVIHVEGGGEGEVVGLEVYVPPCPTLDRVDLRYPGRRGRRQRLSWEVGRDGVPASGRSNDRLTPADGKELR